MADKNTVLTIEDILNRKEFYKSRHDKTTKLELGNLGRYIEVKPISDEVTEAVNEMIENDSEDADRYALFHCCVSPDLSDSRLKDAFGAVTPLDVVDAIFTTGEIRGVAQKLMEISGYNTVEIIDDIKN